MSVDYVILALIAVLGIGGGAFLLSQAKNYRSGRREHGRQRTRQGLCFPSEQLTGKYHFCAFSGQRYQGNGEP